MDTRIGASYRALRHRLGWRQADLAERAGVSKSVISLVECGRIESVSLANLRRIARALDAEFSCQLRWRAGDLDRLMDEGHATLIGLVAEILRNDGWLVKVETSYAIYGERGSIDILAWHAGARMLLVIEVKTDLVVVEATLRKHDEKVRLAPKVAEQFGWRPDAVARLLVLPELSTQRRRVERQRPVFGATYPARGVELRHWLADPAGTTAGLLFVDSSRSRAAIARKRVRVAKSRAA